MKKISKTSSIFVSLLLVISLLGAGSPGIVWAESDKDDRGGEILLKIVNFNFPRRA